MRFLIRVLVTAAALWVSTVVVPGISVTTSSFGHKVLTLIAVAAIFGVVNAVLKPIIKTIGCLFYVVTLGLIAFVVNALLFLLTDRLARLFDLPFTVDGFWAAFWGSIVVAVVAWLINLVVPEPERR